MKFFICSLVALMWCSLCGAHNVLLPAYGERCFFETLSKNDELAVSFQFGDRAPDSTEQLKGDFIMYSSDRRDALRTFRDVSHGDVRLRVPHGGKFEYCFVNINSGATTKDVTFNIEGTIFVDPNDPKSDSLDGAVKQLSRLTKELKNEQSYIVIRERTHRNTAESTNDRVKWWSVFQLGVVIASSLFQVYYLRRFFEVTSYV
ncbi:Endosomal protein P24B [Lachancea thermotolerans]|uniref:KLTH0E06292p n=1 Tax=Lachancea thermotolerans (strain ATCC 56472 / CBS 6340 / NRRL Y-8284) TaxID=559295 RepID=C5DHQ7_LACTC|nr:KLTH0E06292p [Lachancea thermotolerans CBS 6340]CAR23318.1 KLTH0E06292p [Lachancea thermotolerans CBS 6340]